MTDIKTLSDEEIAEQIREREEERDRRQIVADAAARTDEMCLQYLLADGRDQGDPWQEPMGIIGAYPRGWVVEYEGSLHQASAPGLVLPPPASSSGWAPHEGPVIPFWQHGQYERGARARDAGRVWMALSDVDGQRPSEYPGGWALDT